MVDGYMLYRLPVEIAPMQGHHLPPVGVAVVVVVGCETAVGDKRHNKAPRGVQEKEN